MTTEPAPSSSAVYRRWGYVSGGKLRIANPTGAFLGMLFAVLASCCAAVVISGLLSLYVSWLLGVAVFVLFLVGSVAILSRYGLWQGACPHCGEPVGVSQGRTGTHAFNCPICTKQVCLTNGEFRPL